MARVTKSLPLEKSFFVKDVCTCFSGHHLCDLVRSIDACFLKWAVASASVWVSLVKERQTLEGFPPLASFAPDSELTATGSGSAHTPVHRPLRMRTIKIETCSVNTSCHRVDVGTERERETRSTHTGSFRVQHKAPASLWSFLCGPELNRNPRLFLA